MLSTTGTTSSSVRGGWQRTRFQHSRTSIATEASTPCRSRCPARDAIVLLRSPSRDALPDEPTPIGDRMAEPTRLVDRQLEHPVRQRRQI